MFFLINLPKTIRLIKKLILLSLTVIIGVFILSTGVYKDTFKVSSFENNQLWVRRELYRRELGIIGRINFGNKTIESTKLVLDKLTRKIAQPFDLFRYFSIDPISFYRLILFPFFVLGLLFLLSEELGVVMYYLGLATVGSILIKPDFTYWLFIPLINVGILWGVINLKRLFQRNK